MYADQADELEPGDTELIADAEELHDRVVLGVISGSDLGADEFALARVVMRELERHKVQTLIRGIGQIMGVVK